MRLDVRVSNPLNGSQGLTRGGRMKRAQERKQLRTHAWLACRAERIGYRMNVTLRLTRVAPRPLDDDGWQAGAKPIRDGVADYLGIKDNDPRVKWQYAQQKGRPREYAVLIEIQETA